MRRKQNPLIALEANGACVTHIGIDLMCDG